MRKTKKIISGEMLEIVDYPCREDGTALRPLPGRTKRTAEENKAYNDTKYRKELARKIQTNFSGDDYWATFTYSPENEAESYEACYKDVTCFIRRVKYHREAVLKRAKLKLTEAIMTGGCSREETEALKKKARFLSKPLKYIYTIECEQRKSGYNIGKNVFHVHMIISGGLTADETERLWGKGVRNKVERLKLEEYGPFAIASYMTKGKDGCKRIKCSTNLDKPVEKELNQSYSDRSIRKIAESHSSDAEYWEKKYKGYKFVKCEAVFNNYNKHWYLSLIMFKTSLDSIEWKWDTKLDKYIKIPWC